MFLLNVADTFLSLGVDMVEETPFGATKHEMVADGLSHEDVRAFHATDAR